MLDVKGFIGPIGDDLPSLVPILIALTVFFAAFALTLQVYGERNARFDSDLGVLQVVRTLRSDNYIGSVEEFKELCNTITPKQFKFIAGITEQYTGRLSLDPGPDPFDPIWFEGEDLPNPPKEYVCDNLAPGDTGLPSIGSTDFDVLIRTYPIAVEEKKIVRIAHLVVIAWS